MANLRARIRCAGIRFHVRGRVGIWPEPDLECDRRGNGSATVGDAVVAAGGLHRWVETPGVDVAEEGEAGQKVALAGVVRAGDDCQVAEFQGQVA
jgi:hypothetical protein